MNTRARRAPLRGRLQRLVRQLPENGAEQQAIQAGEIDAVIDYANSNVILFPIARRAMGNPPKSLPAAGRDVADGAPVANSLLASLARAEYQRLLPFLEPVALQAGEVLQERGTSIRYVYFPVDCVVCLLAKTDGQRVVEVGMVGFEGMVGISLVLGVDTSEVRALVQCAGTAMRMEASCFQHKIRQSPRLQHDLFRYGNVKLAQARQTAACSGSHQFEPRLACWLLMTSDRTKSRDIALTQEYLASIFNMRRVTVTFAAGSLRARKLISYSRGMIRILNRKGLEAASCGCYSKIEALHVVA